VVDCAGVRRADGRWVWWLQRPAVELVGAEFGLRFFVDPDRPVPREFEAAALARFSQNSKELVCFGSGQAQPGESKPSGLVHGQKRSSAIEDRAFRPQRLCHGVQYAAAVVLFQAAASIPKYHVVILADLRQVKSMRAVARLVTLELEDRRRRPSIVHPARLPYDRHFST
jgi:hypothetical protein